MASNAGWFADWWQSGQFPPAWFAPADESHLTPPERARNYSVSSGTTSLSPRRKGDFKRPEAPPVIAPRSVEDDEAMLLCGII